MFKHLRLNLASNFFFFSIFVYSIIAVLSAGFLYNGLNDLLDDQLEEIAYLVLPELNENKIEGIFCKNQCLQKLTNYYVRPSIQLFDKNKKLMESYGVSGSSDLLFSGAEFKHNKELFRTFVLPILNSKNKLAFLQVQISTLHRKLTLEKYFESILFSYPILIMALSLLSYYLAKRAVRPAEESFIKQEKFIADAGHELKTPLAIVRATCDNLIELKKSDELTSEKLEVINRSITRMQQLISDLLLLTKSEQSDSVLKMQFVSFDLLLREVLGEFGDLFEDKNISLVAENILAVKVYGHKESLHQMITNLLENALKYTPEGGKVEVILSERSSFVIMKIIDTGIGIEPEFITKIFDRFFRIDESRTRASGGTGLGLAIVKAIVEAHKGQIAVSSTVGKGSTFTVCLPTEGKCF